MSNRQERTDNGINRSAVDSLLARNLACECGRKPYVRYDCAGFDVVCGCGRTTESCPQPNEAVKLWKRKYMPNASNHLSPGAERQSDKVD